MRPILVVAITLGGMLALPTVPRCLGQNVAGYGMMADPLLFLIREPAVHEDLELTDEQQKQLVALNESLDGVFLSIRNQSPINAQKKNADATKKTQEEIAKILTEKQQTRLVQIAYRLRGLPFILKPTAADHLQLSDSQRENIESIVQATTEKLNELQSSTFQGKEAHAKAQADTNEARKAQQTQILAALTDPQKQRLVAMLGKRFDPTTLGRVSFRAPELSTGDKWINSKPLQLEDLRGKVIALHFWAFG